MNIGLYAYVEVFKFVFVVHQLVYRFSAVCISTNTHVTCNGDYFRVINYCIWWKQTVKQPQ